jgi:hypothetical protein
LPAGLAMIITPRSLFCRGARGALRCGPPPGLRAAREAIKNPSRTLVVLVTDFEEGVSVPEMLAEIRMLADSGAKLLGLAALDDDARPRYHTGNAAAVASAGMSVAAVSPERLAQWVGDQIGSWPVPSERSCRDWRGPASICVNG